MTRRKLSSHAWVLLSIIILAVATTVALWRQQNNFNEHERIDEHACALAHTNRELIRELATELADDRGARTAETQAKIARTADRAAQLARQTC